MVVRMDGGDPMKDSFNDTLWDGTGASIVGGDKTKSDANVLQQHMNATTVFVRTATPFFFLFGLPLNRLAMVIVPHCV